jgi:AAA family ATP:ADP antiporter
MKVTLVVNAAGSSAEVIPFLKVWAVLPGAILLTYIYTKLSNRLNREQVFYAMLALFLGFFTIFMVFLHPHRELLELTTLADFLQGKLPSWLKGLTGLIVMIRHWHLSLFYVLAELWSAVVLSMLFWGFANEITTVDEAKRFYAIFALGANSSGIFSGQCAKILTLDHYNPHLPFGTVAWEQSLILQLCMVLFLGVVIVAIFRWLNQVVLPQENLKMMGFARNNLHNNPASSGESKKLSLKECFTYLTKSRYMSYITILVVAYNIVYNLSDVLWTEQIRERYADISDFNAYINEIASITGLFATLSALLLSGNVIRHYGWTATAMITPLLWLVTSIGFLGCLLLTPGSLLGDFLGSLLGAPLYTLALICGSAQICLGRAAKYTVFDESKEIAFIPLPREEQRKGKAVVDGIASRVGKSGGSLMIQALLILCGGLANTIPFVAGIFFMAITLWIFAVRNLGLLASKAIDQELHEIPPKDIERTADHAGVF